MLFVLKMEFRKNLRLVSFIKSGVNSIMVNIQDTLLQELGSIWESRKTNKKTQKLIKRNLNLRIVLLAITCYFLTIHSLLKVLVLTKENRKFVLELKEILLKMRDNFFRQKCNMCTIALIWHIIVKVNFLQFSDSRN